MREFFDKQIHRGRSGHKNGTMISKILDFAKAFSTVKGNVPFATGQLVAWIKAKVPHYSNSSLNSLNANVGINLRKCVNRGLLVKVGHGLYQIPS